MTAISGYQPSFQPTFEPIHETLEIGPHLVNQANCYDIIQLVIEMMKLEIESDTQDNIGRRQERLEQLKHLDSEVANLKQQGKWQLFAQIGAGVMGILSGICPIVGHMKGETIIGSLKGMFSSLEGTKKTQFFEGISKMLFSMSEMQKGMGQVQNTTAEADRTRYRNVGDMRRSDQEDYTRSKEQGQRRFDSSQRAIDEILESIRQLTRQLYS